MTEPQIMDSRPTSHMVMLPINVKSDIQMSKMIVRGAAWLPPPFQGMTGNDTLSGEPRLMICSETPIHAFPWQKAITKEALEEFHLQKFSTDFCLARGGRPYRNIVRGSEPPDFVVDGEQGRTRLDCTQFAESKRRQAHALFTAVRTTLYDAPPEDYEHLRGLMVFVWAEGNRGFPDLPPRSPERQALLTALRDYCFKPEVGVTTGLGPLPVTAPQIDFQSTDRSWRFLATPICVGAPASLFFLRNGFELSFHYQTDHSARELWSELIRLIDKHDKPEVEELLVTVGAPDHNGFIYPGEQVLYDFMLEQPVVSLQPMKHLRRVLLHSWETGRILQVFPNLIEVAPPMMKGFVAAHQVLSPR